MNLELGNDLSSGIIVKKRALSARAHQNLTSMVQIHQ